MPGGEGCLGRVPVWQIRSLPKQPEINILYIGPSYDGEIAIFGAVWKLTGAVILAARIE